MYIKKDQNKIEIYLKNKLLQQNFLMFICTPVIKKYNFFKKKDIFLNNFNFLNISNLKTPLGVKILNKLEKQNNSFLYLIKDKKTIFKNKKNFYFNKLNYFFKLWFFKKPIFLNKIWYKKLL